MATLNGRKVHGAVGPSHQLWGKLSLMQCRKFVLIGLTNLTTPIKKTRPIISTSLSVILATKSMTTFSFKHSQLSVLSQRRASCGI